jgi:hypothetical protein
MRGVSAGTIKSSSSSSCLRLTLGVEEDEKGLVVFRDFSERVDGVFSNGDPGREGNAPIGPAGNNGDRGAFGGMNSLGDRGLIIRGTVISKGNCLPEFDSANEFAIVVLTLSNGAEIISLVISLLPEVLETEAKLHLLRFFLVLALLRLSFPDGTATKGGGRILIASGVEIVFGSGGTGGGVDARKREEGREVAAADRESERTRVANCKGHSERTVREARAMCARVLVSDKVLRKFTAWL